MQRLDVLLVVKGYADSRQKAKNMIEEGCVRVDGRVILKPAHQLDEGEHLFEVTGALAYVSRGGLKLEAALDAFSVDVTGLRALDIGASTGGFTDCLLQRGVASVVCVDAGSNQLAEKLRNHPAVTSYEHCNARNLTVDAIGGAVDLIVMDVSFISATYILPLFPQLLRKEGIAVCLIKPQFEVGKAMLGKGGVVKDKGAHRFAVQKVVDCAVAHGMSVVGLLSSPIKGGDGNREFLLYCKYTENGVATLTEADIRRVVG